MDGKIREVIILLGCTGIEKCVVIVDQGYLNFTSIIICTLTFCPLINPGVNLVYFTAIAAD